MIELPAHLTAEDEFVFNERDGFLFSTIHLNEEEAEDIVKRINMHDELVDMIGKLLSEIDACDTYSVANQATIFMAEELLERCE